MDLEETLLGRPILGHRLLSQPLVIRLRLTPKVSWR